ncbi:hypothetical protein UFOVP232_33 [uncultured Caudovirales phage]|uniref:Uncharacterized protein n=1 Tax=uncultured Caudovirales phage TaxID=2100421 RepID=A0A6J7WVB1_9CAUD|nr:hypothetical protein UFOVP232_33 [uncultured Caudovirales phage]
MARKANAFSISKIIAGKREDLARARAEIVKLQDNAPRFRGAMHVVNLVADHAQELGFTRWSSAYPYVNSDGSLEISVSIEGYADSLKTGVVADICERAMACHFEATESEDYLSEWASQRTFKFTQNIAGVAIRFKVVANVNSASESCRKVQVGSEIKEVAKYELVCA